MTRLIFILCLLLFVGCAETEVNQSNPQDLYHSALEDMEDEQYQVAIERFNEIKNKFAYSKFAVEAKLKIADAYFLQESYGEAATSYQNFLDLHPKHEKGEYARFRLAKSYFELIPSTVAQDLADADRALKEYNVYLTLFPTGQFAEEATKDRDQVRETLAEKEMYIARFYIREDKTQSALRRLKKLVELYPDTQFAIEARKLTAELSEEVEKSE